MAATALDNGLDELAVARAAMRCHAAVMFGFTPARCDDGVMASLAVNDGWLNLGVMVVAKYQASDAGTLTHTVRELAQECHANFHRGLTGDAPAVQFGSLSARERLAWECVARHAAWLAAADDDQVAGEEGVALALAAKLTETARTRGISLEPAIT